MRVGSSRRQAWTPVLETPLWTAPWCQPLTPPTTGCAGRPLPLRTSCLVLAGRSPGLEEPPLFNRVPSLSVLSFHSISLPSSHIIHLSPAFTVSSFSYLFISFFLSFIILPLSLWIFYPRPLISFFKFMSEFYSPFFSSYCPYPQTTLCPVFNPLLFFSQHFSLCTSHPTISPVCE